MSKPTRVETERNRGPGRSCGEGEHERVHQIREAGEQTATPAQGAEPGEAEGGREAARERGRGGEVWGGGEGSWCPMDTVSVL